MAAKKKELTQPPASEETTPVASVPVQKVFCKTCQRDHKAHFTASGEPTQLDAPGVGHWPFDPGTDAEAMYDHLSKLPKVKLLIPLDQGEKFGSLATPQINGLKIGIYKGAYLDVPSQVGELIMDSLNQTHRLTTDVKTTPNPYTGKVTPARLDMKDENDKNAFN